MIVAKSLLEAIVKGILEAPIEHMRPSELVEFNVKHFLANRFQAAMAKSDRSTQLLLKQLYFEITGEREQSPPMDDSNSMRKDRY